MRKVVLYQLLSLVELLESRSTEARSLPLSDRVTRD